jgi:cysteine desulfurase
MRPGAKSKHLEQVGGPFGPLRRTLPVLSCARLAAGSGATGRVAANRRKVSPYVTRDRVYLDWNATTPVRREAREAMAEASELCGNPSSVHAEGRQARRLVEDARAVIAGGLGAEAREMTFTSGGTEANALALTPGLRRGTAPPFRRLIVSAIEHASVLAGGGYTTDEIEILDASRAGLVDLDRLREMLAQGSPALVSVMHANNETGAIQPVADIADLVHEAGGLLHVDAIQAVGKIPCDIRVLKADLMTVSGHKLGGPKGVGALITAPGLSGSALLRGGGQELGRRAGTENVMGIIGFGAAVKAAMISRDSDMERVEKLRNRLEAGLRETRQLQIFSENAPRLPNTTLFSAPGLKAETAVIGFDLEGIAVSSGSACSSGKVQPSHVLKAMGCGPELAMGAVRLSLGWSTTEEDVDRALEAWRKLARTLLKHSDETVLERF